MRERFEGLKDFFIETLVAAFGFMVNHHAAAQSLPGGGTAQDVPVPADGDDRLPQLELDPPGIAGP